MISLRPLEDDRDWTYLLDLEARHNRLGFIGRDSAEAHRERLRDPHNAYWMIERDGQPAGFVILMGLGTQHRNVLVKRIAVAEPGQGVGREALRLAVRRAFDEGNAHRVWLDVYEDNPRARRAYQALGFVEEGTMRECEWNGERFRSLVLMSILESEYRSA